MVSLFFILFVALTVFFCVMNVKKEKKSLKETKTFYYYDDEVHISLYKGLAFFFGIVSVIFFIWVFSLANTVGTGHTIDSKIAMYEEENKSIENSIDITVKSYMDYEASTYQEIKDKDAINLVALFPELKSDTLVQKQIEVYLANNDKLKELKEKKIDLSKARKHRPKKVNEKWLQHGDILINSTGQGTLGRIAQVHFQPQNMTVDSHVTIVRPKHELLVYYLGCLLTGREHEFVEMERGSTGQTELPRESVQKYEVVLPDDTILKRFNDLMCPIFQLLVQNQEESLRLAELRDALLPKLMSGELNLSNI